VGVGRGDAGGWLLPHGTWTHQGNGEETQGDQQMISPWFSLAIAGVFEIAWAIGLKFTDGFSKFWPSAFTLVAMAISLYFLAQAIKTIPLGTGYAIWTGIGAAGIAILGIVLFAESTQPVRLICIALIISGIVGLKLTSS
jgi:quaternary ammonium compound-resistance protein SugE